MYAFTGLKRLTSLGVSCIFSCITLVLFILWSFKVFSVFYKKRYKVTSKEKERLWKKEVKNLLTRASLDGVEDRKKRPATLIAWSGRSSRSFSPISAKADKSATWSPCYINQLKIQTMTYNSTNIYSLGSTKIIYMKCLHISRKQINFVS